MEGWWKKNREMKLLVDLLFPMFVHRIAIEMTHSVLVDVTTKALCADHSSCSQVIYIMGLEQIISGIFRMVALPVLGQLSDEYGRKPMLLVSLFSSIAPFALIVINQSKGFVYAYFVLHTIAGIVGGSMTCISAAYVADVLDDNKKALGFAWMMGLFSASHLLGDVIARILPGRYIFEVAVCLLIFVPFYMMLCMTETVTLASERKQRLSFSKKAFEIVHERYESMKYTANVVSSSPTLKSVSFILFFYELGISSVWNILLYYLKADFGFNKNQFSEIRIVAGIGSIISQLLVFPIINPLVGEKIILCAALVSTIASATLYGLEWASWVPYFSASLGIVNDLFQPCIYVVISNASSSRDQGKVQGYIAGVQAISCLLSSLIMTPLTSLFLSKDAPFDCKGFSFLCASFSVAVSLYLACMLKPIPSSKPAKEVDEEENLEEPLLS